jgi:Flp pilus assembly protein CpaB
MRSKIIVVNAGIVILVALLSYVLLATSLKSVIADPTERKHEVERSLRAAGAQLALDALRVERWLEKSIASEATRSSPAGGAQRGQPAPRRGPRRRPVQRHGAFARRAPG